MERFTQQAKFLGPSTKTSDDAAGRGENNKDLHDFHVLITRDFVRGSRCSRNWRDRDRYFPKLFYFTVEVKIQESQVFYVHATFKRSSGHVELKILRNSALLLKCWTIFDFNEEPTK